MKILFLDMDGVLNSSQSSAYFWRVKHDRKAFMNGFEELCPIACNNLNTLLESDPEIKVVISSTWRLMYELKEWDEKMSGKCPAIAGRVIDKTPDLVGKPRGHEIAYWLSENGHIGKPFVVIDDDCDMEQVRQQFVYVDGSIGFDWKKMHEAAEKLGIKIKC